MTLTEFILARVAEDEAAARDAGADAMTGWRWKHLPEDGYNELQRVTLDGARRVLRQCEAIRRIVKLYGPIQFGESYDGSMVPLGGDGPETYWDSLCELASIWSDHPDYRKEWSA